MTGFEFQSSTAAAGQGPYRLNPGLRRPMKRAYPDKPKTWRQTALALHQAALKLAAPVLLLLVLLASVFLYADAFFSLDGMPVLIRNAGLAMNDLVLPGAWTLIHLTNRRFGPAYALAHLLAALAVGASLVLIATGQMVDWAPAMAGRALLAFGSAFLVANLTAIVIFDAARGPRWWTAPLAASFVSSLVFSAIYYPAVFAGVVEPWTDIALVHFLVLLTMSVLLLGPYFLLRRAMRPIGGRNGY